MARRWWLWAWVVCLTGGGARAAGQPPEQPAEPPETLARWEVPGDLMLPLEELLARGFVLLERPTADKQGRELALVLASQGRVFWTCPVEGRMESVNITQGVIMALYGRQAIGVDMTSGKVLWEQPLDWFADKGWAVPPQFRQSQWFADRSIPGEGVGGGIAAAAGKFFLSVRNQLFGVDATSGQPLWQHDLKASLSFPLMAAEGLVFAATSQAGFGALRAADGSVAWGHAINGVKAFFLLAGDLYVAAPDRGLLKLNPTTGEILWESSFECEAKMKLNRVGDRLVAQLDKEVLLLSLADGSILWRTTTPSAKSTLRDGLLCYRDGDKGPIVCVNVEDNSVRWSVKPRDEGVWSMHAAPQTVILLSPGTIEGLDLTTGASHWWRKPGPGQLFDTSTWTNCEDSVFIHQATETRGYFLGDGGYTLRHTGKFFFVHWMRVWRDVLLLHSGAPGDAKLIALPLPWRTR